MKPNLQFAKRSLMLAIAGLIASLSVPAADNKAKAAAAKDPTPKRVTIDTSNLVWPQPPGVARVRYEAMYTGEKIDPTLFAKNKGRKLGWKDRLAGTRPDVEQDVKIPFQFVRVYGVAADSKGRIYAADQAVGAIFVTDPKTKSVELIRNGQDARFGLIVGLTMDDNDRLFVSDAKFHRVIAFDSKHAQDGVVGSDVLQDPAGLAIDHENRFLYVVDTARDQVMVFDADTFKLLRTIGQTGKKHTLDGPGEFSLPTNVAVDSEGDVYVTDTLNNRVEIFDADGNFISEFGKSGDGPGHFARPKGIAVDCDRHIWVVDEVQSRVQVFDREGRLLIYFGEQGQYPGQFQAAYGITIDQQNNVIVSEQFPGRVQVFHYVTDAEAAEARKKSAGSEKSPAAPVKKSSAPDKAQNSAEHAS